MTFAERVRLAGVVGAGGAGFPTHVKMSAKAGVVIGNGAECEPLLHKDAAILRHHAADVVRGIELAMEAVGAKEGVVAVKASKREAVEAVREACTSGRVRVQLLGDYYPAGDEYDLVYTVTGRLIPPGGIPRQGGVVGCNVETLGNLARAEAGQRVTRKTLTLAGALRGPVTITVPLGTTYREAIAAAGGLATDDPVLCVGGLMMGETTTDLDTPITKTATGVVVLPRAHPMIRRKLTPPEAQSRIGKSACDQCRYCTELCPRFLLGYAVEPHQVMRTLAFTATGAERWSQWAALCCGCGLCTLCACPEGLFPKEACDNAKAEMRRAAIEWTGRSDVKPHPMREGRRVPIKTLMKRLAIQEYDRPAEWRDMALDPRRVVLPLKQGAGVANLPMVKAGDRVAAGQPLGEIPAESLGALLHAPFAGRVVSVTDRIVLERVT